MRNARWLMLGTLCLGCSGDATGVDDSTTYTGDFSAQFVENAVYQGGVRLVCANTYNMVGTVTVTLSKKATATPIGHGTIVASENWVSVSGKDCSPGPSRNTNGEWGTDLTGTPTNMAFTVSRDGGTTFVITTTYTFNGILSGSAIAGTVSLSQIGSGITGGTVVSNSSGMASANLTLH